MKRTKVNVHIDELILYGIPDALRYDVATAIEQELARLFSEPDSRSTLARSGHIPQIALGNFEIAADAAASTIGAQIAQGVYSSILSEPASQQ